MINFTFLSGMNGFLAIVLFWIVAWRIKKNNFVRIIDYPRLYWTLGFSVHVTVFYAVLALASLKIIDLDNMTIWSSCLRLHSIITFVYIQIAEIYCRRHKRNDK